MIIESKLKSKDRQAILSMWGTDFYPLLSVHTLEIGYDVPQVRIAIILASTSNINQAAQRIGRILRKAEGKNAALIYTIYLSGTYDYNHLGVVKQATEMDGKRKEANNNNKKTITLLCIEKEGEFCHRHLVKQMIGNRNYFARQR